MTSDTRPTAQQHRDLAVRRFVLVALVLPTCLAVTGLVVQSLPALAVRGPWDRTASAHDPVGEWWPMVLTLTLGLGFPMLVGLSCLPRLMRGERSPGYRVLGAQALGIAAMQTVMATGLRLEVPAMGRTSDRLLLPLVLGLVVGMCCAVAGWRIQPGIVRDRARGAAPLDLATGERAVWMRTTSLPWPAVAPLIGVLVMLTARVAAAGLVHRRCGLAEFFVAVIAALLVLLMTTATLRVSVGEDGLRVRSLIGPPWFRVPLEDVAAISVVTERSLGRLGGWGIRALPGRVRIIMGPHTGMRVERRSGGYLMVTVDDAATGAALLEALVARAAITTPASAGAPEEKDHDGYRN